MSKKTNEHVRSAMRKNIRTPKQIHPLFKSPLFWITAFIILALITYASVKSSERNNAALPAPDFGNMNGQEAICGNGLIESGENCATCFIDSPCASNELCSVGVCMKKKFNILVLTLPAIILALLAIGLLGYQVLEFRGSRKSGEIQRLAGLIDYISRSIKAGQKDTEIMINVVRAGWDKNDAAKAIAEAKKSLLAR